MKILLIEDSLVVAETIIDVLSDYSVTHCDTGEKGLQKCQAIIYDAIILDNGLPKMSGLELLSKLPPMLRRRTLFFSGDSGAVAQAENLGVAVSYDKTFGVKQLLEFIKKMSK